MTSPQELQAEIDRLRCIVGNESPSSLDELEEELRDLIEREKKAAVEEFIARYDLGDGILNDVEIREILSDMFPTP